MTYCVCLIFCLLTQKVSSPSWCSPTPPRHKQWSESSSESEGPDSHCRETFLQSDLGSVITLMPQNTDSLNNKLENNSVQPKQRCWKACVTTEFLSWFIVLVFVSLSFLKWPCYWASSKIRLAPPNWSSSDGHLRLAPKKCQSHRPYKRCHPLVSWQWMALTFSPSLTLFQKHLLIG